MPRVTAARCATTCSKEVIPCSEENSPVIRCKYFPVPMLREIVHNSLTWNNKIRISLRRWPAEQGTVWTATTTTKPVVGGRLAEIPQTASARHGLPARIGVVTREGWKGQQGKIRDFIPSPWKITFGNHWINSGIGTPPGDTDAVRGGCIMSAQGRFVCNDVSPPARVPGQFPVERSRMPFTGVAM